MIERFMWWFFVDPVVPRDIGLLMGLDALVPRFQNATGIPKWLVINTLFGLYMLFETADLLWISTWGLLNVVACFILIAGLRRAPFRREQKLANESGQIVLSQFFHIRAAVFFRSVLVVVMFYHLGLNLRQEWILSVLEFLAYFMLILALFLVSVHTHPMLPREKKRKLVLAAQIG